MTKLSGKQKAKARKAKRDIAQGNMARRKKSLVSSIRTFDDPVLRMECEPIKGKDELTLLKDIGRVLDATPNGIGLAAPQIGATKCAVAIRPDIEKGYIFFLVNPEITESVGEEIEVSEGCLSYPGYEAVVKRNDKIIVKYLDEHYQEKVTTFSDRTAVIVAHEIDHLSGVCAVGDEWKKITGGDHGN